MLNKRIYHYDRTTWFYLRDAQGNPMALYKRTYQDLAGNAWKQHFKLEELTCYGSSRLGVLDLSISGDSQNPDVWAENFTATINTEGRFVVTAYGTIVTPPASNTYTHRCGIRNYEFTNHLGNVLYTFTDHKLPHTTNNQSIDYYLTDITSAQDYYPGGMLMPGRSYSSTSYRYGFNGQEKDDEITGVTGSHLAFEYRIYDSRIGRFLSVDPLASSYPWNSTYAFAENNPIRFIDLEGLEKANPEMFTLALEQINHYRSINSASSQTKVANVSMYTVLDQLEQQITSAMTNGCSNAETNYMGYYCGKSAAQNDLIMYNPMGYVAFMYDLFSEGTAQFGDNGLKVSIPGDIQTNGTTETVPEVDEVFGKSVNSSTTNKSLVRGAINLFSDELSDEGNTIPFEYNRVLGAIGMKSGYSSFYGNYGKSDIERIQTSIANGYLPIVFENHGITGSPVGGKAGKYGLHYIPIHSLTINGNQVDFEYWDYGSKKSGSQTIEQFTSGIKGYWIPENE